MYERFLGILFVFTNSLLILLNLVDVIFFRYISKRTTTELYEFFFNPAENTGLLLSQFVIDFWYMFLIFFIILFILVRFTRYFISQSPAPVRTFRWYLVQTVWLLFFAFLTIIFARGGFQLKPIGLISAAQYTESRNIPLLINTPFSVIKTKGSKALDEKKYFTEPELSAYFNPLQNLSERPDLKDSVSFKGNNVIILILESLGRQYVGYYNQRLPSLTPFLDSILDQSVVFRGYANGKRSIEALPSILAGIPSLMPADYPSSPYINNHINGLGRILKNEGYTTAFFHGGNNGTMGFDLFSYLAGFEHYYGRNEYGNDADFDGQWGIYDEPFLQFAAEKINSLNQPFAAGIFTLSSHHPYKLPKQFEGQFPYAMDEKEATFCFLDYSLRAFFKEIQGFPWYDETIFVITADHTPEKSNLAGDNIYNGLYEIPLAFYMPSGIGKKHMVTAQHIDIMPTLIGLLEIDQDFMSFGRNLFDTRQSPYVLNYLNGMYKIIRNDSLIVTNGDKVFELYSMRNDPVLKYNLAEKQSFESDPLLMFSRAVIQQYNNRMIKNNLFPEKVSKQSENQ